MPNSFIEIDAWELLGLVFHDRGQFYEGADALERASLLVTVSIEARIALASCYASLQRKQLARELYLEIMLRGGVDTPLLLQLAAGLEAIDEPRLAMEACRRAESQVLDEMECPIESAQIHYDMGFYAMRAGFPAHLSEALTRRAISLSPENVHYRIGLVSLLIRLDRFEEAFDTVSGLSTMQINDIQCKCCLERIANLLSSFGDGDRSRLCRQRLQHLQGLEFSHEVLAIETTPVDLTMETSR